jgi:hypothetical protein
MQLGEIYFCETDQALGHELRNKYHIYICESDWKYICESDWKEGHTFLFISKTDYGGDFKITKKDYPFLPLDESYISCGRAVFYDDAGLVAFPKKPVGALTKEHMKALYAAIHASETMEAWQIMRVCNALKVVL